MIASSDQVGFVQRSVRRKRSEEVQPELLGLHSGLLIQIFAALIANPNLLAVLTTVIDARGLLAIRANDRDVGNVDRCFHLRNAT